LYYKRIFWSLISQVLCCTYFRYKGCNIPWILSWVLATCTGIDRVYLLYFAVLSFTWTVIISHYCQCHCSLTIVFSVFNVHPSKIPSTLETKKTRSDPAKCINMTWLGDQNPLCLLPPYLYSVYQSPCLPKLASARRRAEWEYKSTTLLYSHQMVFYYFLKLFSILYSTNPQYRSPYLTQIK
jgi:hypothetical protein